MLLAALAIAPQRPLLNAPPPPVRAAIAEGLRFVRSNNALGGSFAIDLAAMTFGMPRARFAVLAVCRSTINQTVTPDRLRGRMSAVFTLVVTSGPRLGDIESGLVAGLTSALTPVVSGGLACIVGVGAIVLAFPDLAAYDERAPLTPP
jgi:hypothetical protein